MKMEIVFDTSTAILLAKITLLKDVAEQYVVIFPERVEEEIMRKEESFDAKIVSTLIKKQSIMVIKERSPKIAQIMEDFHIEQGEAEAIYLAQKRKCSLAIDDGPSIKVCKIMEIPFTTAIHFLANMHEQGLIDKGIAMEKLKDLERYGRYRSEIIQDVKKRIGG